MILKKISEKIHNLSEYIRWYRILHPGKKTAYLVAMPTYENIGDAAIVMGMKAILADCGYAHIVEITTTEFWNYRKCIKRLLPSKKLVFLVGGGNMGDVYQLEEQLRRTVLDDFPNHQIVIFPQTIFYKDEKAKTESVPHYNRENITITAREKTSYEMMKTLYPKARIILAPDAVLAMDYSKKQYNRKDIVLCFRGDSEQLLSRESKERLIEELVSAGHTIHITDMLHGDQIPPKDRKQIVEEKLNRFANAQLVITDRLHAMILCAISGTPCLVFGNNHHKVSGVYEWIKYLEYIRFVHSVEEVLDHFEKHMELGNNNYEPITDAFRELFEAVKPD